MNRIKFFTVVINIITGLVVLEQNIEGLNNSIIKLIEKEDFYKKFGSNRGKHIKSEFDLEKQSGKLKELYEEILRWIYLKV